MKVPFSLFLALRYLKPKRTFLSIITVISILGVTIGIMVLIVVISVMTGFDQELRRKILGFDAHLLVSSQSVLRDWRAMDEQIQKVPGVVATAPFVQGPVVVEFEGRRLTPKMRGVDVEREQQVTGVREKIVEGAFDLAMDEEGNGNKAVIGRELASQLGVTIGTKITVFSPGNLGAIIDELNLAEKDPGNQKTLREIKEMVLPAELVITGIFESGRYDFDAEFILVPLHIGQELYLLEDGLHGITVKTRDPYEAETIKNALLEILPLNVEPFTWIDLNRSLFDAIRLERNVLFIILFFVMIVAGFCIMNTLITVTVLKTREIGIMKALGANAMQIVWVFVCQGVVIGVFGNVAGVGLAMTLLHFRNEFKDWLAETLHIEIFPAGIYQFAQIPAEIVPNDIAIICGSAFTVCCIAAFIPAWFAARWDPVKALRFD